MSRRPATFTKAEGKTSLYRHYNELGILLYVGISSDHHLRFQSHLKFAEWKDRIATVKIERFNTRDEAAAAEIAAIQTEEPLYNTHHQREGSVGHTLKRLLKQIEMEDLIDWEDECSEECDEAI